MANRSKQIKNLRQWHYVVYRSVKTGQRRKFDSRVKLYAEVYSKKSGKRIGYVNKVENNQPLPRRFSNKARLIYHEGRKPTKTLQEKLFDKTFSINYSRYVRDQIPDWVSETLNEQIDRKGFVQFSCKMSGKDNKGLFQNLESTINRFENERSKKEWLDILESIILHTLRANQIRTSPKKYSKGREYWKSHKGIAEFHYLKKYLVQIKFYGF